MTAKTSSLTPQGVWDVKRRMTLPEMTRDEDAAAAIHCLEVLPGVRGVRADLRRRRLTVTYDLLQVDYRRLLETLTQAGYATPDTRWSRFKASWLQGLDETGRQNASVPPSPCCSQPPPGAGGTRPKH